MYITRTRTRDGAEVGGEVLLAGVHLCSTLTLTATCLLLVYRSRDFDLLDLMRCADKSKQLKVL